nr:uncharacterized protein LOC129266228 [Lytechinus pictus]
MSNTRDEVAKKLHHWATKEMHFIPQGKYVNTPVPSPEDFREVCRGNLLPVWKYVLEHVHSAQKVHKVKGNLTLKSLHSKSSSYRVRYQGDSKFSAEREELVKRRRDLQAKVTGVKADIQHLDEFLQKLEKQIVSAEEQYQQSCDKVSSIQHKRALLKQFSTDCKADAARYLEYRKRLEGRLQQFKPSGSNEGSRSDQRYFSRHGTKRGERTDSPTLETACTKTVRDACSEITVFLREMLQGKYSNNQQSLQSTKDKIWTEIEKVMAENPPQDVLQSLATITLETTHDLRQMTTGIDIKKDAEELRFRYESGALYQDTSTGPSQLQSVHQMIEEKQASHIHTFMEAEKSRNRAWKLDKQLVDTTAAVDGKLAAMFSNNPGALELARKLFSTELEASSANAALQCLRSLKNDLSEVAATEGQVKEALYAKHQKIQDFKGLSDQKQNLIQVLVRQNMDGRKKLEDKQKELGRYIEQKLSAHEAGSATMTTKLKNRITREVDLFASLPLHLLQITALESGEDVPVCQLSINRLSNQSPSAGGGVLQEILAALKYPMYKAPECLFPYLSELKIEMADIEGILESQKVLGYYGNSEESGQDIIKHIQGLCKDVESHAKEQTNRLLPVLQKRLAEATSAMSHCMKSREHVTAWWDQPAQHLTPWVKVEGQTMQQWLDKWMMIATQIKQLDK